ncbi:DUF7260 family protein [Halorubrum vacuolatum]|uniref:DUF7260 domain-containing protein n=1 Tax=Halorubrum vacuolatum TaxID=63740 RepID=A0A238UVD1_HALVU|nr:hypothetical protein [Halorubrum vacuolatum]SNR25861.1 hypothetical protein SAMN06264855_101413 [Halorubrum vacuolatum]
MTSTTTDRDELAGVLRAAHDTLRVERRRVVDEREAFEAFRDRVSAIPTRAGPATGTSPLRGVGTGMGFGAGVGSDGGGTAGIGGGCSQRPGNGLIAVRDAYVKTVMSVPHYEEEYDDTYETSIAIEFGPDLAVALTQEPELAEPYKRALISKTTEAIEERERFVEAIDLEQKSLDRAIKRLLPITEEVMSLSQNPLANLEYGTLDAYRVRTETLEQNCDAVVRRRQDDLDEVDRSLRPDETVPDVATYLYQDLSATYPVLSTVALIGDRLRDLRRTIEREMIHRR